MVLAVESALNVALYQLPRMFPALTKVVITASWILIDKVRRKYETQGVTNIMSEISYFLFSSTYFHAGVLTDDCRNNKGGIVIQTKNVSNLQ